VSATSTSVSMDNSDTIPLTKDGQPLKRKIAKALRREKLVALALISPLLLFILVSFIFPIVGIQNPVNSLTNLSMPPWQTI